MKRGWCKTLIKIALPLAIWLGAWQLAAMGVGQSLLLPGPVEVVRRLAALAVQARFWRVCLTTLGRVFLGGALGAVLGVGVAALAAWWEPAGWILNPLMKTVRATPVASFILLIWLWCRSVWVPVVIAALMSAPVVWAATAQAVAATDPQLLELARAYRFTGGKTLRLIYIPSALPAVGAGCRTALGLAWKAGVAAEVLCRPRLALGTEVYNAKLGMETADLFAWTAAVIGLSFVVEWCFGKLMERGARSGGAY